MREAGCGLCVDLATPQTRRRAILIASRTRLVGRPEQTHCQGGREPSMFSDGLAPWVSMGEALGLTDGPDRPARTVAGHRAPRWVYGSGGASYATGWTLRHNSADRVRPRAADGTQPTRSTDGEDYYLRFPAGSPAPTVTGQAGYWALVNGNQDNACRRSLDEPAGTLFFGRRVNNVSWVRVRPDGAAPEAPRPFQWVWRGARAGGPATATPIVYWTKRTTQRADGRHADIASIHEPARTITHDTTRWELQPTACWPNDRSRPRTLADPAPTVAFGNNAASWVLTRPATTVLGDPRLDRPGRKDRESGEAQFAEESVRITIEQAAVLQGFPPDHPWQGTKSSRFAQVGNAVPVQLARAVLAEASGASEEYGSDPAA